MIYALHHNLLKYYDIGDTLTQNLVKLGLIFEHIINLDEFWKLSIYVHCIG